MTEPRGRARSRTYSAEDEDFSGEIDALHSDGKSSSSSTSNPSSTASSSSTSSSTAPAKPQVSKKTIDIMTRLDNANMRIPDQHNDDKASLSSDDEEAAAERELEEQERKKRLQTAGPHTNGPVANNATTTINSNNTTTNTTTQATRPGNPGPRRKKLEDNDYDVLVKILLLGDSGVGKTSLMLRYSEDKFSPSMTSTAGVDYKSQMLEVDGKRVKCQIWDTAGQQRFHVITHSYYKSAHGIVLVYDTAEPHEER